MPSHYENAKRKKISLVMREWKEGRLSSSNGEPVTDRDQALAIALSEAERESTPHTKRRKVGA